MKATSIAAMIAAAGLIALPQLVVAQTPAQPSGAGTPGVVSPANPMAPTRPAMTGTAPTPSTFVTADQQTRASKVIGSSVYNEQDQKIGSINDLLIGGSHNVSDAVLSVGGFLGIESKLVKVSFNQLKMKNDKMVMSGATKDQLMQLPEYKYQTS